MPASPKNSSQISESAAFELIELASDDLDVLARAFDVINKVCTELSHPGVEVDQPSEKVVIN